MGMQSFREPVIVAGVHTAAGVKTLAIFAGSSDAVYAIDADNGSLVWQKELKWSSDKPQEPGEGAGFICNNALTATPVVTRQEPRSAFSMYSPTTVTCAPWTRQPVRKKTQPYK